MRSLLVAALFLSTSPVWAASTPKLRQVLKEMPPELLGVRHDVENGGFFPQARREELIKLDDVKNGYLELQGTAETGAFGRGQLALFKKKDGSFLFGFSGDFGDSTTYVKMFLRDSKGAWRDVTEDVLPKVADAMADERMQSLVPAFKKSKKKLSDCASGTYAYVMPRHGTTIEVEVRSDCYAGKKRLVLWKLPFDGEKFTLK